MRTPRSGKLVATMRNVWAIGCGICFSLACSGNSYGIVICDNPVNVTVVASAPTVAETGGATAQFNFSTGGSVASDTHLTLQISGTATNGVDYQTLPTQVTIIANQTLAALTLTPISDAPVEGAETVTVTIIASDNLCVEVGFPDSATVSIVDGPKADTTTVISAHTPDPSMVAAPIAVTASVTVTPPGVGTPAGTIAVGDGTANCLITLPATGCNLYPSGAGTKTLTATYAGDAFLNGSVSAGVSHTVNAITGTLDIDASLAVTEYDALTDGLLVIRYLFGLTGTSLTSGALSGTATRTDPAAIKAYLDFMSSALDIDGNGTADALTDGLLIVRYLFGLRGSPLIAGAVDPLAARKTAVDIEAYLQTLMP